MKKETGFTAQRAMKKPCSNRSPDEIHTFAFVGDYPPTTRMFVGSSRFQSIPMGSGGIQRITGFLNGNTASRGPVQ